MTLYLIGVNIGTDEQSGGNSAKLKLKVLWILITPQDKAPHVKFKFHK